MPQSHTFHFQDTTKYLMTVFCGLQETNHHLCLQLQDFKMWCFSCQAEVQPSDSSAGSTDGASPSRPKVL